MKSEKGLVQLNLYECAIDTMDFADTVSDVLLMEVMDDDKNSKPDPPQRNRRHHQVSWINRLVVRHRQPHKWEEWGNAW